MYFSGPRADGGYAEFFNLDADLANNTFSSGQSVNDNISSIRIYNVLQCGPTIVAAASAIQHQPVIPTPHRNPALILSQRRQDNLIPVISRVSVSSVTKTTVVSFVNWVTASTNSPMTFSQCVWKTPTCTSPCMIKVVAKTALMPIASAAQTNAHRLTTTIGGIKQCVSKSNTELVHKEHHPHVGWSSSVKRTSSSLY